MILNKVICDKCGKDIFTPATEKINVVRKVKSTNHYGREIQSQKVVHTFHLCDKCRSEFDKFMNVTGETEK